MGTDEPRTRRHRGLTFLTVLLVSVLVLVIAAAGFGWWTVQRSFPTTSGRIDVPGIAAPVTVYRDDAGIPQLVAETDHDLFFAQGYVHAQDRFWEMDFRRHVTAGRMAELFGETMVATDAFIRTLDWRAIAEQELALLDPVSRAYYDAYAEGVNAYLGERGGADLSLEYAVLGLQNPGYAPEPWTPVDSIAWLKAMAWDLRSNLGDEIDRALLATALPPEEVARLHPGYAWGQKPTIMDGLPAAPTGSSVTPLPADGAADGAVDAVGDASTAADADTLTSLHALLDEVPELLGPEGGDLDRLLAQGERNHCAIELVGIAGNALEVQVGDVGAEVREPPRDALVVADDHAGQPREGVAGDVERAVLAELGTVQAHLSPDRGHRRAEVGVVGEQRLAGDAACAGDGPVI